jgi:hypothetical protein
MWYLFHEISRHMCMYVCKTTVVLLCKESCRDGFVPESVNMFVKIMLVCRVKIISLLLMK